ncbi:MAG: squalene/phytoene synthase family protein [Verrucomicrobia bacterium]|nr:squalene/phytoene synthase family protein [Verrucomicrobiota bacterium]MCF7708153.1 squalene/phytoene synthase family protein [Verrucomicrobiota bacterium]
MAAYKNNAADSNLLSDLLRDVSRSFYLTLRILPRRVRRQIGLAYLLARAADTIADTEIIPLETRTDSLAALETQISRHPSQSLNLDLFSDKQASHAEKELLTRLDEAIALLHYGLEQADKESVIKVLMTIISGQKLDLERFAGGSDSNIKSLNTDEELLDYTYRVAGCVGEFWTELCFSHLFKYSKLDKEFFLNAGIKFGRGLQLINILRDIPQDLRKGRCYIPSARLDAIGLEPRALIDPKNESAFRSLYDEYLQITEEFLAAGWQYTVAIPFRFARIRLACAWPLLIGIRTLTALRSNPILDHSKPVKISRSEVKQIIKESILLYPFTKSWKRLFNSYAKLDARDKTAAPVNNNQA